MVNPTPSIELEHMGNGLSGGDSTSLSTQLISSGAHAEKEPECRKVYVNLPSQAQRFCTNEVITAKYNVFTFLPKNLWQQFTRVANQYFLIISALQMLTPFSPTSRFTTFGPLCAVVMLSMVKELYEDTKRHRQDNETNSKPCIIGRGAMMHESQWRDVKVGDILQVTNRQLFPADLLVLSSSDRTGNCYIETAGLDGETNLKIRNSLDATLALDSIEKLQSLQAFVECDLPNNMLYTFNGNLVFPDGRKVPIAPSNMLLRGAALRNTKYSRLSHFVLSALTWVLMCAQGSTGQYGTAAQVDSRARDLHGWRHQGRSVTHSCRVPSLVERPCTRVIPPRGVTPDCRSCRTRRRRRPNGRTLRSSCVTHCEEHRCTVPLPAATATAVFSWPAAVRQLCTAVTCGAVGPVHVARRCSPIGGTSRVLKWCSGEFVHPDHLHTAVLHVRRQHCALEPVCED